MAPKVLLVDDDALIHRLYRQHIERAGFEMLSAGSGLEALDVAARESPQVIVMDIMMPEMDGLSALRELRREEATKTIPVIVMTANPQYQICQQESQCAGATVFLTKPFGPAQLVAAIQGLVSSQSGPTGGKDGS